MITTAKILGFIGAVLVVQTWRVVRHPIVITVLTIAVLCIAVR